MQQNDHKDSENGHQLANFNVRITDKISDTFDVVNKMFNCVGEYLYEGKFVEKDDTFIDLHIPNGANRKNWNNLIKLRIYNSILCDKKLNSIDFKKLKYDENMDTNLKNLVQYLIFCVKRQSLC